MNKIKEIELKIYNLKTKLIKHHLELYEKYNLHDTFNNIDYISNQIKKLEKDKIRLLKLNSLLNE